MPPCECLWLKASAWVSNKTQRESTGILLQPEIDLMLSLRGVEKESCTRYIAHHIPTSTFTYSPSCCLALLLPLLPFLAFCAVARPSVPIAFVKKQKHVDWCRNLFEIKRERENLNATFCACIENCFEKTIQSIFKVLPTGSLHAAVRFCGRQCEQSLRVIVHVNLSHSWLRLHCFSGCRHVCASLPVQGVRSCPRTCNGPDLVRTLGRGLENIRNLSWILSDSSSA